MDATLTAALDAWIGERDPGARLARAWPLKGGVSSGMIAFEALKPGRPPVRYVLRQPSGQAVGGPSDAARREHQLLSWLDSVGAIAPAPSDLDMSGVRVQAFRHLHQHGPERVDRDLRGVMQYLDKA